MVGKLRTGVESGSRVSVTVSISTTYLVVNCKLSYYNVKRTNVNSVNNSDGAFGSEQSSGTSSCSHPVIVVWFIVRLGQCKPTFRPGRLAVAWLTGGCKLWQAVGACQFPSTRQLMRALLVLLLVVGCGGGKQAENGLDQRARDSTVGASTLPGAAGVRGALRSADSAVARNSRIDSLER
jgi:hypothetical protein